VCWTWCDPEAVHADADTGTKSDVIEEPAAVPIPSMSSASTSWRADDDAVRRFHNPILPTSPETDMAYLIASIVIWLLVW
jgi:hypothetical protein